MLHRRTGPLAIAFLALTFAVPAGLAQKKGNGQVTREPSSRKTEPYSVGAHRISGV